MAGVMSYMLSPPTKWMKGRSPSVSVKPYRGLTVAVCVYDGTVSPGIDCCVGTIDKVTGVTQWGNPAACADRGSHPSVSLLHTNGRLYVIEANSFFLSWQGFQYRVGEVNVDNKTIEWGTPDASDGTHPKVSTKDDGTVMAVTEKGNNIQLYRGSVNINDRKAVWRNAIAIPDFIGTKPDISINADKIVVACCSSQSLVYFKIGRINGENLDWISVSDSSYGWNPSISLNSNGAIMEVHQTWSGRKLSRCCGYIDDNNKIIWGERKVHDYGEYPSVSLCDDGYFYEVHKTNFGWYLFFLPGQLMTPNVSLGLVLLATFNND